MGKAPDPTAGSIALRLSMLEMKTSTCSSEKEWVHLHPVQKIPAKALRFGHL